ncbi:uncharacterized protein LOC106140553 isoform X1 [Amyelois transitella]|uniref:uncharacterized protein LOC106140553 isoform X1 n=1 Tax=Amyelois transitella TaxID=680683 RepID=UPI00298FA512|nr:uncharacterized protein LOC106140553 isoform X1 [Amyelois transitella]
MMHMWMWSGYDIGEFLFSGLWVNTQWAFALTWLALFFVAMLFEGSKVFLAEVQRQAQKKLYPYRSDERRNLLCEREQSNPMEPTTSRNASTGQVSRWSSFRVRALVNFYQSAVFVTHNVVGYLLMLAVMIYNIHLILAVVFGMMVGYFLFGTSLTKLQMKCFSTKRVVICTPECDDTAGTTPPLIDSSSESDFFICRTRTCIQPSHYFPTASGSGDQPTCHYGAKSCPSKVAKRGKTQPNITIQNNDNSQESEKEDSPSVEDVQLLRTERQGCCKEKVEKCKSSQDTSVIVHEQCCKKERVREESPDRVREVTPQITCCHSTAPSESQEQIM